MLGRALLLFLDWSTLLSIRTLYCWVLSKKVSSTILKYLIWRDLGLNPGLPDHWRTLCPLDQCGRLKSFQATRINRRNKVWRCEIKKSWGKKIGNKSDWYQEVITWSCWWRNWTNSLLQNTHTHTHTLSLSHTHTLTHTHTHTLTSSHTRTHTHILTHTHTYIHTHTHTHTFTHTHTHPPTNARTHTYSHIHTHTPAHSHTHTRTHTRTLTHTHTHTHTHKHRGLFWML